MGCNGSKNTQASMPMSMPEPPNAILLGNPAAGQVSGETKATVDLKAAPPPFMERAAGPADAPANDDMAKPAVAGWDRLAGKLISESATDAVAGWERLVWKLSRSEHLP